MSNQFDFIVVGAGAAGCLLASRLSRTSTSPSVLLIEAGNVLDDPKLRAAGRKFVNLADPNLGWADYSHVQKNVSGKSIIYPRGKGLGGSTMTNAMVYYVGSSEEYDYWADVTGCPKWRWPETKERFRRIERFQDDTPIEFQKYAHASPENHGSNGPVDVSLPSVWESGVSKVFEIAQAHGFPINLDQNSGNPIGIGLSPSTVSHGLRTTAASAFLENRPPNLTVWTDAVVTRILFNSTTAVGVELANGRKALGTKATILCAGALDTPKLLLLSGIGPKDDLVPLGIKVVHDLPGVGKNLQDHLQSLIETRLSKKLLDRDVVRNGEPDTAGQTWSCLPFCFLKVEENLATEEFKRLEPSMQQYLKGKTVPQLSLGTAAPLFARGGRTFPDVSYYHVYVNCLMNPQSRGDLRLRSANPQDPPCFDFNALSHPYDLRAYINNTRKVMEFIEGEANSSYFAGYINGPVSRSDEDIEKWLKAVSGPQFHATGTVMMGRPENKLACVDADFRVLGVENLYVADLSVCPTTPCCMTQSTAYMIAETAAETLIEKYSLEG